MNGKRSPSKAQQNGVTSSQAADYPAAPDSESLHSGRNHSRGQPHATTQGVDSAEEVSNGHRPVASTADDLLADPSQDSPHQNASRQNSRPSRQDAAGQQSYNRASQQQAGYPHERQSVSSQVSGHPQMQGLSSRRRSMERQSASLTLPFEQLNFVFHHINYSVPATVSLNLLVPSCSCVIPRSHLQGIHSFWKQSCISLALWL